MLFNQEKINHIVDLYTQELKSMDSIAYEIGCCRNTIRKILSQSGISIRKSYSIKRSGDTFDTKDINRFWAKVSKNSDASMCWEWSANKDACGYGRFGHRNKLLSANRVSWELHYGRIPQNLHVLHKCDNPSCCNPHHLFLGTHKDNMTDRDNKKRTKGGSNKGEKNPRSRYTEEDILQIRELYKKGWKQKDIANKFKTSQPVISGIVIKKYWKHI